MEPSGNVRDTMAAWAGICTMEQWEPVALIAATREAGAALLPSAGVVTSMYDVNPMRPPIVPEEVNEAMKVIVRWIEDSITPPDDRKRH